MGATLATIVLCKNAVDGIVGLSLLSVQVEGAVSYLYDVKQLQQLSTLEGVAMVRTPGFARNPARDEIEQRLAELSGRPDVRFLTINGTLRAIVDARLLGFAEREGGAWAMHIAIEAESGETVEATATTVSVNGRTLVLHDAALVGRGP